jgi:mRNA interferase RelE/StbE
MNEIATITIPKAEYDAMRERLEDLEDILAARAVEDDERIPHEIAERLLFGGDHPIRVWREHRGLTQKQLAEGAGLRQGYLSEIESGKKPGSVAAFKALASALDVDVDDLLTADD